ncbi:MAG: class I SAM-dependent methyltransferase [Hyphomicrobium sp.]
MNVEHDAARHYTHGALERAVLEALLASGKDLETLAPSDLSSVDEFHLGWLAATIALAENLSLESGMHVLDVGSGIGGPARYFAETYGCRVTGIDITGEFVTVASALTRRCGLADVVSFCRASALAMPFANTVFDAATLIHVGMNVADKARLFREVRRVLRSGARFGVYDVVDAAGLPLPYPMPWAATVETGFLADASSYWRLLVHSKP